MPGNYARELVGRLLEAPPGDPVWQEARRFASGAPRSPVGRPSGVSEEVRARIHDLASQGVSANAIARTLDDEQVPTAQGGAKWRASSVLYVLRHP